MTVLIYHSCLFYYFCSSYQSMGKKSYEASKSSTSTLDTTSNGKLKKYSAVPRHNSFSSCSNDSSISYNSIQTRSRNAKRLFVEELVQSHKRSRNSSGSSHSSNISGVSDKDLKSSGIISQTKAKIKSYISSDQKSPYLKYSEINSSRTELKEETVSEELDYSENSPVSTPKRHNLRGKITKKACTCCPSTCATVVFRRSYKRYIQTGEEKTVISSTKVRTYIKKTSPPSSLKTNEKSNTDNNIPSNINTTTPCNKSRNRKRKSEIEKLYESLHEIEWAKNFSPDNILTQISVRQAAACSAFGHSQSNSIHSPKKNSRKHRVTTDLDDNIDSHSMKSENSELHPEDMESNSHEMISSMNEEITNCDNKQDMVDLHTAQITTSVNISSCSMPHLNVKEISINTRETVHTESLIMENGADSSNDAQLCYTSDESSSAIASNIVSLQSKHSLDFSYTDKKRNFSISGIDIPEYSATTTFFDIAEEGIRTIDACFREVGAEVVVSTCYEDDSSLPMLTSIKDNKISNKTSNDNPPVLEPCTDTLCSSEKPSMQKHSKRLEKEIVTYYSKNFNHKRKDCVVRRINSHIYNYQSVFFPKTLKKVHTSSELHWYKLKVARKIIKKYLKLLLNKSRLKYSLATSKNKIADSLDATFSERQAIVLTKNSSPILKDRLRSKITNGLGATFNDKSTCDLNKNNSRILRHSLKNITNGLDANFMGKKSSELIENRNNILKNRLRNKITNSLCASFSDKKTNDLTKNRNIILKNRLKSEITNGFDACYRDKNTCVLKRNSNTILMQNSVASSKHSKLPAISYKMISTKPDKKPFLQTRSKSYPNRKIKDKVIHGFVKNGSCLYNKKQLRYSPGIKKIKILSRTQRSAIHSRSGVTSFITTTVESKSGFHDGQIDRPPLMYDYSSDYKSIRVNRSQNYTHIILLVNRGKSIFLTLQTLRELRDALIRSNNDSNCPVLIINGIGDSFCSGLDVTPLIGSRKKIVCTETAIAIKGFIEALSSFKKPLAAVVNGPAWGLGMTILNHIDIIIASEKATFCMPNTILGYMPEGGATLTLPQIVGSTVAMDLFTRGKVLTAREACNVGLISEVYEAKLLPHELVFRLKSLAERSPSALVTTKALMKLQLHVNLQLILENEVKLLPRMWLTRTCQDSLRKALDSGIFTH